MRSIDAEIASIWCNSDRVISRFVEYTRCVEDLVHMFRASVCKTQIPMESNCEEK